MPLYDVLAIVAAATPQRMVAEVLRRAATTVHDAGGVVTDIKSFGTRQLAYAIRKAGVTHTAGQYVQLSFATNPKTLDWIAHDLRTDERVVRWLVKKQQALAPLPKPRVLAQLEREIAAQEQQQQHAAAAAGGSAQAPS